MRRQAGESKSVGGGRAQKQQAEDAREKKKAGEVRVAATTCREGGRALPAASPVLRFRQALSRHHRCTLAAPSAFDLSHACARGTHSPTNSKCAACGRGLQTLVQMPTCARAPQCGLDGDKSGENSASACAGVHPLAHRAPRQRDTHHLLINMLATRWTGAASRATREEHAGGLPRRRGGRCGDMNPAPNGAAAAAAHEHGSKSAQKGSGKSAERRRAKKGKKRRRAEEERKERSVQKSASALDTSVQVLVHRRAGRSPPPGVVGAC